jgi:site-specific DNA-cytosine methylase
LTHSVPSRARREMGTIRKRLFVIARRDGKKIVWPEPTHGPKGNLFLQPYRTAAECIDWSIPCPSIFGRKRPLAEATLKRIARGIQRFVINAKEPFIVNMAHGGKLEPVDEPLSTVANEKSGCRALVTPYITRVAHGERDSNDKKRGKGEHSADEPFSHGHGIAGIRARGSDPCWGGRFRVCGQTEASRFTVQLKQRRITRLLWRRFSPNITEASSEQS